MSPRDDDDATDESGAADESNVTSRPETGGESSSNSPPTPEGDRATADELAADDGSDADDDSEAGRELPPILDVRESLDRIERDADADVSDELARIRSLLDRYEARDDAGTSQASVADDVDGLVVSMRERLSGDAERWADGIENRLRIYRESRTEASELVHVSGAELRDGDSDERIADVEAHRGETATLSGTVVNQGEERDGVVRLTFYDDDHRPVGRVESRERDVDPDAHREITERVSVPDEASYYDVTAVDADAAADTDD